MNEFLMNILKKNKLKRMLIHFWKILMKAMFIVFQFQGIQLLYGK
jgi:hypothetical protein